MILRLCFTLTGLSALVASSSCLLFVDPAPQASALEGYRCDDTGACLDDYVCVEGVCVVDTSCDGIGTCAGTESCVDGTCLPSPEVLDVLLVVDNSGSMQEEQAQLVAAFPTFVAALSNAGVNWRVGVITTDVGLCDNRLPDAQGGDAWGFRPQRGCLHGDGVRGEESSLVLGANTADAAGWLAASLANIGIFGSPIERGLDAMEIFLDPTARRSPGCEEDLQAFRREGARLVVVVVTDEDDCSHRDGKGNYPDENLRERCGEFPEFFLPDNFDPQRCYSDQASLQPVSSYTGPGTRFAVIGGAVGGVGDADASQCFVNGAGAAIDGCVVTFGTSNLNGPGEPCDPAGDEARGGPCCVADAATRYAAMTPTPWVQSICGAFSLDGLAAYAIER